MVTVSFEEAARRIRTGEIGVVPTDTLYGLVASVLDPAAVERVYRVRGRETRKPCIVLLGDMSDIGRFGIDPGDTERAMLAQVWPGEVSVVLPCRDKRWDYIHRGTGSIAFRVPSNPELHGFLVAAGPVVAPSANPEGERPAETVEEARAYFGTLVDFFVDGERLSGAPSTVARIVNGKWEVLREGAVALS